MKRFAALMVSGLLASTAAFAQDKMAAPAPAPATPAATSPSGMAPAGDTTKKKSSHHSTKKKTHKTATASTGDTKKSADAPAAAPMAPSPDAKK